MFSVKYFTGNYLMDFKEYQQNLVELNQSIPRPIVSPILAVVSLSGEVGELANEYKKLSLKRTDVPYSIRIKNIKDEIGDVLGNLCLLCHLLNFDLNEIAERNLDKIEKRYLSPQSE